MQGFIMQKDWTSFQISFLLYFLIILFPVNIYFANALTNDTQNDTTTISDIALISGNIKELSLSTPLALDATKIDRIDKLLKKVNKDFISVDSNQFSVGFDNPQNLFGRLHSCWKKFKMDAPALETRQEMVDRAESCWKITDKLMKVVAKMADEKRERALNALYLTLVFTMIITVAMIYFVRTYMKIQLDKHTIYDLSSKLFNRNYFMAELPKNCSLSSRHDHPLSLLFIVIDEYENLENEIGAKAMNRVIEVFGGLLVTLSRGSDVACRYSKDQFAIITAETTLQNAMVVAERIRSKVLANDFGVNHPITVSISVAKHFPQENVDELIERSDETLTEAKKVGNKILSSDVQSKK